MSSNRHYRSYMLLMTLLLLRLMLFPHYIVYMFLNPLRSMNRLHILHIRSYRFRSHIDRPNTWYNCRLLLPSIDQSDIPYKLPNLSQHRYLFHRSYMYLPRSLLLRLMPFLPHSLYMFRLPPVSIYLYRTWYNCSNLLLPHIPHCRLRNCWLHRWLRMFRLCTSDMLLLLPYRCMFPSYRWCS